MFLSANDKEIRKAIVLKLDKLDTLRLLCKRMAIIICVSGDTPARLPTPKYRTQNPQGRDSLVVKFFHGKNVRSKSRDIEVMFTRDRFQMVPIKKS